MSFEGVSENCRAFCPLKLLAHDPEYAELFSNDCLGYQIFTFNQYDFTDAGIVESPFSVMSCANPNVNAIYER
jgi:hypothetical protein